MIDIITASDDAVLEHARAVLAGLPHGDISDATRAEYRRAADRIERSVRGAARSGVRWTGVESMANRPGAYYALRAAWTRRASDRLSDAVGRGDARTARGWLSQLELYPPATEGVVPAGASRWARTGRTPGPSRSKRGRIAALPPGWLDVIWTEAVRRGTAHLDAVAVLLVTGCRPAELVSGVGVDVADGDLVLDITGAKVRGEHGQPWRRLSCSVSPGPAAHLAAVGPRTVSVGSANAISMLIADLASDRWGRRVSAYDARHQRAADVRIAFQGDLDACARWLGHSSDSTIRYYARLPRSAGVRGAEPVAADAPRPVRRRSYRRADPSASLAR